MDALADDTALIGTPRFLARGFGVTTSTLLAAFRDLLERDQIAVQAGRRGQLTVRRASPRARPVPPLAPREPRRRAQRDVWIV